MPQLGYGPLGQSMRKKKNSGNPGNPDREAMLEALRQFGEPAEGVEVAPVIAAPAPMTATAPGDIYGDAGLSPYQGYGHGGSGNVNVQRMLESLEGQEQPTSMSFKNKLMKRLYDYFGMEDNDIPVGVAGGAEDESPRFIRN